MRFEQFELDEASVLEDYFVNAQNSDIIFLKKFDNNRLLMRYRENAGMDTQGVKPYSGWESRLLAGHSLGHYLSAVAQAVKATGDAMLKDKLIHLIDGLSECQSVLGTGLLFGATLQDKNYIEMQFDILEGKAEGETWVPWYNLHKLLTGLMDTYRLTGNELALTVGEKLGDWIVNRVSGWSEEIQEKVLSVEFGGINDCLYDLYDFTDNDKYLDAAHKFDHISIYEEATAETENTLNGKHANTTIPKFVGAIKRYEVLAKKGKLTKEDEKYLEYAEKFFARVIKNYSYITGGVSVMEHFRAEKQLDATRTQTNCESCCAHNLLKMAKELFKVTGKKEYADYYEKTLRNSIMATVREKTGQTAYFVPMASGYYKTFGTSDPATNMYWCCTGSGMENFTKLADSIYFHSENELVVNQYIGSKLIWDKKNLVLTQDADVTKKNEIFFSIDTAKDGEIDTFSLLLRKPDWTKKTLEIFVNGETVDVKENGDGYVELARPWKAGDTVKVCIKREIVAEGLPDDDSVFAFRYGPIVLAAKLGNEQMEGETWAGCDLTAPLYKVVGNQSQNYTIKYGESRATTPFTNETLTIQETLTVKQFMEHIADYLVKDESTEELCFHLQGTNAKKLFDKDLSFVNFSTLNDERYGIYWYFDTEDTKKTEEELKLQMEKAKFDASILDSTQPGYGQYEKDFIHQLNEKNSEVGNVSGGGSTRLAKADGFFSYHMIVNPEKDNRLMCQFAKEDNGKTLRVSVGTDVIFEETLSYQGKDDFYTQFIDISNSLVKKNLVIVKEKTNDETESKKEYSCVPVKFESMSKTEVSARLVGALYMAEMID